MRIAFMGSPAWAVPIVEQLHAAYPVSVVYTQQPKPQNRGHKVQKTPVHTWADQNNIPVEHPVSLKKSEAQETFEAYAFDWVVVAAYGLILPKYALTTRYGATNVHASILPRWRGAAPLHRAILAGDKQTGISIMQMDEGLDTGAVWSHRTCEITPTTTIQELHDTTSHVGGALLVQTAPDIFEKTKNPTTQPTEEVTYAEKIQKAEGELLFNRMTAEEIMRRIRALSGWPGTFFTYKDSSYKIHSAKVQPPSIDAPISPEPGEHIISQDSWIIGCKDGVISIETIQKSGSKPMFISDFLNGMSDKDLA